MLRRRRIILVALVGLLAWAGACSLTATSALRRGQEGREALRTAQAEMGLRELLDGSMVRKLNAAADAFDRAHDGTTSALWLPLRSAPVIGRHLESARSLTRSVRDITRAIADAGEEAERLVDGARAGPEGRLAVLQGLGAQVEQVADAVDDADLGPGDALLGPFGAAYEELAAELTTVAEQADRAGTSLAALGNLLEGPSSTLVFAANNAEMRAGAGMFLAVGELRSDAGRSDVADFVPVEDVVAPPGSVELPDELDALWGWAEPDREIRNLMLSPRFPVAAAVAADVWSASGRPDADGVIAIDPVAIGHIVKVTGPVQVGQERFDATSIVDELLHEQYVRFGREDRPERQERSAEIAAAVLREMVDGDWDLVAMAEALDTAVAGRHLLAWSGDPTVQAGWAALGAHGDLGPESVLVALNSRGAGKTDPFVRVAATMATEPSDAGVAVRIRVCIRNKVPRDEPPTVTKDRPELALAEGDYRGILTATVPAVAKGVRFEDVDELHVRGADGPSQVIGYQLDLARNASHEVVLQFELPASWTSVVVEPSARVPAVRWSDGNGSWRDRTDKRRPFTRPGGPPAECSD